MSDLPTKSPPLRAFVLTANQPGAIGIIQVHGDPDDLASLTQSLCERALPGVGNIALANFADIDHGLLVRIDQHTLQLMPHGGLRIMQLLRARLAELGCAFSGSPLPQGEGLGVRALSWVQQSFAAPRGQARFSRIFERRAYGTSSHVQPRPATSNHTPPIPDAHSRPAPRHTPTPGIPKPGISRCREEITESLRPACVRACVTRRRSQSRRGDTISAYGCYIDRAGIFATIGRERRGVARTPTGTADIRQWINNVETNTDSKTELHHCR